jgi:3-oxocholest-4-en-26-oyl-CoA dehydrogenase beta subunit
MDFTTTEAADDLGGLARTITESVCTAEHQRKLDGLERGAAPARGGRFDRDLWGKLIEADILSTAAPESLGGGGFGVLEQVAVLVALGRQLAAVPYLESVVLGAGALAKFGSESLQQEWAAPAINGEKILAVALDGEMGQGPVQATASGAAEAATSGAAAQAATSGGAAQAATSGGAAQAATSGASGGFRLTGSRTQIAYGPVADAFLVPAETDSGTKVFLIAADDPGVTVSALDTTGRGSVGHLDLRGVEADRVVGGDDVVAWLTTHGDLGRSAYQLGVLERALELTSEYAREREQFDRPIGSFQAVSSRLADAYIDVKGLRLTVTQAAWRLSEDLPADVEVGTAAFWAADAGHRVAHTTVHVHGGVGIDLDHPVHRYFLAAKQTEFAVGSATGQLLRIGRELADTPA